MLLVAGGINFVDFAGAELLAHEAKRRARLGGGLYFYRLKDEVMDLLGRAGFLERIGRDRLFAVRTGPIAAIYPKLDQAQCRDCTLRIFRECRDRLPDGSPRHPDR